ncbi:translation elongation factor Ts [Azorhizobium doebereinerae]|uniref:translation elongation factor Ts n=1 Tax=Azorhizobium doebereinerae TaxID=281091 RepID=UPI0004243B31|nr:translation elongation factor Ts [Azorhizobium doebereinerae]
MAAITAGLVKELRDKTGAGMMDCKAALTETDGDIEAAIDWLRKKGLAKAAKKAGRVAAEGLVAVESSGHYAAAIEVNAETDFVARNADFQAFVREAAKVALNTDGTIEAVAAAHFPGESVTVADKLATLIATIGENMTLRRAAKLTVSAGVIATYVHGAVSEGQGRIGVLVALESTGDVDKLSTLGRQIAMHVAALNPLALDASGIDEATIAREKAILLEKHQGKPANVQDKIAESGMKTYFKEVTLLEQPFVHDGSKTVAQVLKENEGSVGAPIKLTGFVRYALGEGIEKEETDFAAEVAAAAGQS